MVEVTEVEQLAASVISTVYSPAVSPETSSVVDVEFGLQTKVNGASPP